MPATILCIDDQEHGLFIRKIVLEREGYRVLTATNGARGLSLIDDHEVDAVVLDYRMEGMDGEAVASLIKRRRPELPVLMLSGYAADLPPRARQRVDAVVAKGEAGRLLVSELERILAAARP